MSDYQFDEYTFRRDFPVLAAEARRRDRAALVAAVADPPADADPAGLRMAETWLYGPRDTPLDEDGT